MANYKVLFSVGVSHSYFEDDNYTVLDFRPSESTKAIFSRYRLILKATQNGFAVYTDTTDSFLDFLNLIADTTGINSFDFGIAEQDVHFLNYSELPIERPMLLYSSADELNQIDQDYTVLHPVFSNRQNGTELGQLRIEFKDLAYSSNNNFQILFEARFTYWQYYIIVDHSQIAIGEMVISGPSGIEFSSPEIAILPNGQKAYVMTSMTAIQMSQKANKGFNLIINGGVIELPNAGSERINISEVNGEKLVFSTMYIYY